MFSSPPYAGPLLSYPPNRIGATLPLVTVGTSQMRSWWSDYRCLNQRSSSLRKTISLFGLNAGYCALPFYDAFLALEMALKVTGYSNVRSVWIPRNCPLGIGGADCQADGTNCSIHNYGVAVDIDPFAYGNPHFQKAFGNTWDFRNCKITERQVQAVEAIKNTEGETMFRWLGWPIGDTMHFEGQVPPLRARVDWNTVAGYNQGANMHPPQTHTDFVNAHKISVKPSWFSVWASFLGAKLTTINDSWAWPAQRLDLAYLHEKAILPLGTRISELETDVGALLSVNAQQTAAIEALTRRLETVEARPVSSGTSTLPPGTVLQLGTQAKVL